MFEKETRLFGLGSDRQVISLDWDSRSLRVVQWQLGKGKARVLKSLTAGVGADV